MWGSLLWETFEDIHNDFAFSIDTDRACCVGLLNFILINNLTHTKADLFYLFLINKRCWLNRNGDGCLDFYYSNKRWVLVVRNLWTVVQLWWIPLRWNGNSFWKHPQLLFPLMKGAEWELYIWLHGG